MLMPRARRLKSDEMVALLESHGWERVRQKGSHQRLTHVESGLSTTVPAGQDPLGIGLQKRILADAGLTNDDVERHFGKH